jgi:PleD family two-component response regulator
MRQVTMSVGIVACDGDPEIQALMDRVDKRLYEAKRLGRNRVVPRPTRRASNDEGMPLAGL